MTDRQLLINQIGFGLMTFGSLFGYVVILTASFDLLAAIVGSSKSDSSSVTDTKKLIGSNITESRYDSDYQFCDAQSTAVMLFINSIPYAIIKLIYPAVFLELPITPKIIVSSILYIIASLLLGTSSDTICIYLGIIINSIGLGIFDPTFLSMTPKYNELSFRGYVIGSGFGEVTASLSYAWLRMSMSIQSIMLLLLVMPVIINISYAYVIKPVDIFEQRKLNSTITFKRNKQNIDELLNDESYNSSQSINLIEEEEEYVESKLSARQKLSLLPRTAKYFVPVSLTYTILMYTNQGVYELVYFPNIFNYLNHAAQYRWYQVSYLTGGLLARMSITVIKIPYLWLFPSVEFVIMIFFLLHAFQVLLLPSFYFAIFLIVIMGMMSGGCYVNSISEAMKSSEQRIKGFVASVISNANSLTLPLTVLLSLVTHADFCNRHLRH